ncbi:hypothetical protein L6452_43533 [Arctium lappa]|uniref:Uncharacterized protein n=1 Tax=Arctium lappa TaxID=4217 RepID=A0ACB8XDN2_ARCLA|nr:hypothetical protein L6452_43533 [Arctium lappa]
MKKGEVDIKTPSTPADSVSYALFSLLPIHYSAFPLSPSCPNIYLPTPIYSIPSISLVFLLIHIPFLPFDLLLPRFNLEV